MLMEVERLTTATLVKKKLYIYCKERMAVVGIFQSSIIVVVDISC